MDDLIYNQTKIPKDQWRYGLRTSAATGCGWIATYNALRILGKRAQPEELIRWYERQLPLLHGNAGTMFFAPAVFFSHHGFRTRRSGRRLPSDGASPFVHLEGLALHADGRFGFVRKRYGERRRYVVVQQRLC